MANEYRATTVGLEVLEAQDVDVIQRVTSVSAEVMQVDDDVTDIKVTAVGLEVSQVDDDVTDIKASLVGLEVLRSIDDAAPGTLQELAATVFASGFFTADLEPGVGLSVRFRGEGRVVFPLEIGDRFVCTVPEVTTWTRNTPQGPSWGRATRETTAWICAGDEAAETGDSILAYVNGDVFTDVAGDHIKLIG